MISMVFGTLFWVSKISVIVLLRKSRRIAVCRKSQDGAHYRRLCYHLAPDNNTYSGLEWII